MTDTPKSGGKGSARGDQVQPDEENEVFFGKITHKERRQAVKYSRRRTVLYIPGFRKDRSLMRYSHELTPDGPLIYAHEEEITETVSETVNESVSKKLFPSSNFPSDSFSEDVKKLFSSESVESSPMTDSKDVVKKLFPPSGVKMNDTSVSSLGGCDAFPVKTAETSSRLMSDSGVGDSVLSASKLSESAASRIEAGITIRDKVEEDQDDVFVQPLSITHKAVGVNPMTNYASSFLSESDAQSDISDIDGFKRPFRLQGVFHGTQLCQNISTPRIPKGVPNLSFSSPHLLVSPIASYKSVKEDSDSASTKSSDSTPTRLVVSSVSAFSRNPATTAIRRSLRKKSIEDGEEETIQQCLEKISKCANVNVSPVANRLKSETTFPANQMTPPPKPGMVSTATQSDFLSLPSTLEGQQLLLVKSSELAKGQLESSPESLVSQSSWSDLKLSALGINRERLGLATVSSDSSSFKTSGDTNLTNSSDAQKPDIVSETENNLISEVTKDEVLESLGKKAQIEESHSPSTEYELGMNSEFFTLNDNESTTPDLYKSHGCEDYVPSDQIQSQTEEEEDSDLDIDPADIDTLLPEDDTVIENDYSPVKGRSYERQMKRKSRPGLVWPNRYMSDSESSETEDLCEQSFESGSSDSSLLEGSSENVDPLSPPSMEAMSVSFNDGKLQPWRPPGFVEAPTKKSTEGKFLSRTGFQARLRKIKEMTVKGTKKGSKSKNSSNKENQNRKFPKSPLPKDCRSEKDKKKTPCRKKKQSSMQLQTETEIDNMTKLHTLCNGQRVVRYLNFSESPMIIKHYPAPKEASKLVWDEHIAVTDLTHHSPVRTPHKPKPKPILTHRPTNHTYPFSEDVPSPIILTRTRRTNTLSVKSQRVTQL